VIGPVGLVGSTVFGLFGGGNWDDASCAALVSEEMFLFNAWATFCFLDREGEDGEEESIPESLFLLWLGSALDSASFFLFFEAWGSACGTLDAPADIPSAEP